MACGAGKERCLDCHNKQLSTTSHVCSYSSLSPTSPASLAILTCAVECGCGFSSTGGGCECNSWPPVAHSHHSDSVVGTTVQSCQVVVGAITCSVD